MKQEMSTKHLQAQWPSFESKVCSVLEKELSGNMLSLSLSLLLNSSWTPRTCQAFWKQGTIMSCLALRACTHIAESRTEHRRDVRRWGRGHLQTWVTFQGKRLRLKVFSHKFMGVEYGLSMHYVINKSNCHFHLLKIYHFFVLTCSQSLPHNAL